MLSNAPLMISTHSSGSSFPAAAVDPFTSQNSMVTTLDGACEYYEVNEPRGEFVLVIAGKSRDAIKQEEQDKWKAMSEMEHVQMYMDQGMDKKEAMKAAAKDRGVSKRDIYNKLLESE